MSDKKPEELNTEELDQVVGGKGNLKPTEKNWSWGMTEDAYGIVADDSSEISEDKKGVDEKGVLSSLQTG